MAKASRLSSSTAALAFAALFCGCSPAAAPTAKVASVEAPAPTAEAYAKAPVATADTSTHATASQHNDTKQDQTAAAEDGTSATVSEAPNSLGDDASSALPTVGRDTGHDARAPSARLRAGSSASTGALSAKQIKRVVRANLGAVRSCYLNSPETQPKPAGRISVKFTIGPTGSVVSTAIQSTSPKDAALVSCTSAAVKRMQFPAPANGGVVTVSYPFHLSAPAQ